MLLLGSLTPKGVVLFTDGEPSYKQPQDRTFGVRPVFGSPYRPARKGSRVRFPKVRYRQDRTLRVSRRQAQPMVRKTREGGHLVGVEARAAHGSEKRLVRELSRLGFEKPNTSTIERRNGTARTRRVRPCMDAISERSSESVLDQAGSGAVGGAGLQLGPGV